MQDSGVYFPRHELKIFCCIFLQNIYLRLIIYKFVYPTQRFQRHIDLNRKQEKVYLLADGKKEKKGQKKKVLFSRYPNFNCVVHLKIIQQIMQEERRRCVMSVVVNEHEVDLIDNAGRKNDSFSIMVYITIFRLCHV